MSSNHTQSTDDSRPKWRAARAEHMKQMRSYTFWISITVTLTYLYSHDDDFFSSLLWAGKFDRPSPGPEDYGFIYNETRVLAHAFAYLILPVWVISCKLFGDAPKPPLGKSSSDRLSSFNMAMFALFTAWNIGQYLRHLGQLFLDVNGSSRSLKNRPDWKTRAWLVLCILAVRMWVNLALPTMAEFELGRVHRYDWVVLLPLQVNVGIILGTKIQGFVEWIGSFGKTSKMDDLEQTEKTIQLG